MKKILCLFLTSLAFSHLHSSTISWTSPPTTLSGSSLNASSPQVAMDAAGNTVAVWVENNYVKASTKSVSGSWTSEVNISGTGASSPYVVTDSSGNATAVWVVSGVVFTATKPFNSSWSSSRTLSKGSGASAPTLCVDSAGDVIAAWLQGANINTSTKLFGGSWGSVATIHTTATAAPNIAIGGSGSSTRAVAVWQGTSSGNTVIYSATRKLSSSWGSQIVISSTASSAAQPAVAMDSNANAVAIWYSYDLIGTNYINVTASTSYRTASTNSWSPIIALSAPGLRNPSSLSASIAFDSTANIIALWSISFDDELFNIESAVKPVFGKWSAPVDLVSSNLYAYVPGLSVTTYGDVLGTYMFYNGASLLIQAVESHIDGFLNNVWSVPVTISRGAVNAYPKIAAALNGNVINTAAVWVNYNGTNTSIAASTGSRTLVLPPTSLSVTQSSHMFGAFTEYYNTLSWTASTDPNAVGYLIFRNGVYIGQVGSGTTSFIDDNRVASSAVTYSVVTVDAQQTQSRTMSVTY
jgi:hypothetical protein